MKLNWLHITFLSVFLCTLEVKAAPNDYDGVWTANVSCSAHKLNAQLPAYAYDENWQIQNGVIKFKSVRDGKQGSSETSWIGSIENGAAKLTGNAFRVNNPNETWNLNLNGAAANEGLINLSGGMFNKNGLARDCTVTLKSYEPSNGSLAYIKSHPVTSAPTNTPIKNSTPSNAVSPAEKNNTKIIEQVKDTANSTTTKSSEKAEPALVAEANSKKADEAKSSESISISNNLFIIFAVISIALAGIAFIRKATKSSNKNTIDVDKQNNSSTLLTNENIEQNLKIQELEKKLDEKDGARLSVLGEKDSEILELKSNEKILTAKISELEKRVLDLIEIHARKLSEKDGQLLDTKNDLIARTSTLTKALEEQMLANNNQETESKLRLEIAGLEQKLSEIDGKYLKELKEKDKQLFDIRNEFSSFSAKLTNISELESKTTKVDGADNPVRAEKTNIKSSSPLFCGSCGTKNDADAIYCIGCGKKL